MVIGFIPGADPGGGGPGGQDPPPFGGPPNFIKKEKMARACARKLRILVLNSYPDPPPPPPFRNPVSAPGLIQFTWFTVGGIADQLRVGQIPNSANLSL